MDTLRSAMESPRTSSDPKTNIMETIRQDSAVTNARALLENISLHCFEKCVPKPATSLSRGEQTCMTLCMEKYMAAWNTVRTQYLNRIQREQGSPTLGAGS
ncbi:MAG: protein translocase subunit [Peltula sp. TS41687]|nr:MAG: protein translocase subunit [Peltula sp. TS41687]